MTNAIATLAAILGLAALVVYLDHRVDVLELHVRELQLRGCEISK